MLKEHHKAIEESFQMLRNAHRNFPVHPSFSLLRA